MEQTRGSKRWEQMEDAGVKDDVNDSLSWLTERLAIKVAHPSMKPKVISGKKTEKETSGGGGSWRRRKYTAAADSGLAISVQEAQIGVGLPQVSSM